MNLSSISRRFFAYLFDSFILLIPLFPLYTILSQLDNAIYTIANIAINCMYEAHFLSSKNQATIGQKLLKISVVRLDGKKINWDLAFCRCLSQFFLPALILFCSQLIDVAPITEIFFKPIQSILIILMISWYTMAVFSLNKQTLHDRIYKTAVVNAS